MVGFAILCAAACAKPGEEEARLQENALQEAQQRFDAALDQWELARAEEILVELEAAGATLANLEHNRSELASRHLRPEVYDAAPVTGVRTTIDLFPSQLSTDVGCGSSAGEHPIRSVDAPRALALYREAGRAQDELEAAYVAADLDAFEDAWRRLDTEERTVDRMARRARILARHGRNDDALAQARKIAAQPDAGSDRACGAELLTAKLQEAKGALGEARESYARARDAAGFGQCRTTAEARIAALAAFAPTDELPRHDVRVTMAHLEGAQIRVVLKAHHPSAGYAILYGWMGDDDPSSWHNADVHMGVAGRNEGGGVWRFEGVTPGWYSVVVIVDGAKKARLAPETCIAGVYVQGGPAEVGPIAIVWE